MDHRILLGSTALVAVFTGSGMFADVTPEEVWDNWQAMITQAGQTVTTADVSRDGDTLTVSGLTFTSESDKGSVSGSIDEINLTDTGDGSVEVTMSESFPLLIKSPAAAGIEGSKPTDLKVTITEPDMVLTVSGTAEAMNYAYTAPVIDAKLESINGQDASIIDLTLNAKLNNVTGNYLVEGGADQKKVASSFTADSVAIESNGKDAEKQSDFTLTANVAGLSGQSSGTIVGMEDMAKALAAGFAMNTSLTYTGSTLDMTATTEGKPTHVTGTSGAGGLTLALDAKHLQYALNAAKAAFSLSSPDIPFPQVDVSYDEAAFSIDIPTAKSDAPTDFTFLTKLVGFNVSEPIWGMIDPTGALPHDGATIILDTKGKATLKSDLFTEMEQGADGTPPSGELNALDLTELKLSIAGAELTGNGALTFDNSDMETYSGMPAPTGKVDLKLTGANGLLDKIVAMGYLKAEDVMGYKMMAGMFTVSSPDKDELTSTLEFKDKGFYANGQRLQ